MTPLLISVKGAEIYEVRQRLVGADGEPIDDVGLVIDRYFNKEEAERAAASMRERAAHD